MNTTNTILIILLVVLVGFGIWYFTATPAPQTPTVPTDNSPDIQVEVDTPDIPPPEDTGEPGESDY